MTSVILAIHIMLAISITILVLLQRSEGGAMGGLGGGQGANGLFTARQAGNILTKATTVLFICFVVTSLTLVLLAKDAAMAEPLPITASIPTEQL